ncbi:MAG TPA: TIGR03546 family protein [Lacipirellulaceae bacterium]|jgi:uncharacterized protein (TIGR03546 family)
MLSTIVRPLRQATAALLSSDSPRQLAAGFALGMVLGLLPKGNLIALSLCVLVFSLRVNTSIALIAAVAFSWTGAVLDPFAAKLGLQVLGIGSMQATYASVLNLPLGPWLGFNNTAVLGSLLIGIYLAYPVYWVSLVVSGRMQPRLVAWATNHRRASKVLGAAVPTTRRAA